MFLDDETTADDTMPAASDDTTSTEEGSEATHTEEAPATEAPTEEAAM